MCEVHNKVSNQGGIPPGGNFWISVATGITDCNTQTAGILIF